MSSELATLKQQMEIVIHLLQDPSARQAPAHPLNSAGLLGPYPHTMPSYPALRRVPQQQPFATRPPQVPQQHSSLVQAPLHCFQRAPEPSHHSSPGPSSSSATFKWKADRGKLTVADAWDEFHGPLAAFKRLNPSWPVNTSDQRAYNRRYELIRLINEAARREGRNPEDIVAEWSQANEGKTINSLLISMKAREQEDPEDDQ
ncbi:hypothetical protein BX616_008598 [Lobosporangium transversale]|nr:hypothetical protein BX616_008598 [Lobosporangium transversale]